MINYIEKVYLETKVKEGNKLIEKLLVDIYLKEPISNKDLARLNNIPIPIASAVKKEFIKEGLVDQISGSSMTELGRKYVEEELGYKLRNKDYYNRLMKDEILIKDEILLNLREKLELVFENRPKVDVSLDQSKITVDTAIKRAILGVKNNSIVNKNVLCVGDDDLTSVALAIFLKELFDYRYLKTKIYVYDIDTRILDYIKEVSDREDLRIEVRQIDLRVGLEKSEMSFDTVFTDPPYTINGLKLFVDRGLESLKREKGLKVYLSFASKTPEERLVIQKYYSDRNLLIEEINKGFNLYEGAGILGNQSQMTVLTTTEDTIYKNHEKYDKEIYTGEVRATIRSYRCKTCRKLVKVGKYESIKTIEQLKESGCSACNSKVFELYKKQDSVVK